MRIKLPGSITGDKAGHQTRTHHPGVPPARDLKPAGRPHLSRRPTAAPRRTGY
ncbi:hypothetical protein [Nonomuraea sp. SBT364]|uniref:hypothetical protein n=1 Tax=Nonomuraea sp. SBT364 TaxID=1580530 RepID=UPI000B2711FF|nr:hypothetical protein [Nonomuraea sp. SBT364]